MGVNPEILRRLEALSARIAAILTNGSLTTPTIASPTFSGTASGSLTNLALTTPTITPEGWTVPTFTNSWVELGSVYATAAYRKLPDGNVQLRGGVKNGTALGAAIFTLPAGYRPTAFVRRVIRSAGQMIFLDIATTGVVNATASATETGSTAEVMLEGVMFPTS